MHALVNIRDLARLTHRSIQTIRNTLHKNPELLPPRCRLPGSNRILWRQEDLIEWLKENVEKRQEEKQPDVPESLPQKLERRGRGRPRKSERLFGGAE